MTNAKNSQERRNYFRVSGTLYVHIVPGGFSTSSAKNPSLPDQIDSIDLQLHHYRNQLKYKEPENFHDLDQLTQIIQQMHHVQIGQTKQEISQKKSVIISGSGMEFFSQESYPIKTILGLKLSFPEYPFTTIYVNGSVIHCTARGEKNTRHQVGIVFDNIDETDRDIIIQFVNYLQRKKLRKGSA